MEFEFIKEVLGEDEDLSGLKIIYSKTGAVLQLDAVVTGFHTFNN